MKKILYSIIIVVLAVSIFSGGFWFGKNSKPSIEKVTGIQNLESDKAGVADFNLFWDAWTKVQENFVNRSKLDYQKMIYGAISGMLGSLDDPYTVFFPPEENKAFSQSMQGNLEGIGAEIGNRQGVITIISPLKDSPAMKIGLKAGDKVFEINGKSTSGLSVEEAVSLIRGPKGTEVTLTVLRDGWSEVKEFKITRAVINIPIVKLEMKQSGDKKIAYLALYQFTDNSVAEFEKAVHEILSSNVSGLVFDLRGNPGGYLESAVEMASWFLPEGQIVVTEDFGNGKKDDHKSLGINKLGSLPTIVLIDQGSASASEILAGALRDNLKIKLVGEKSFGKGSVQKLESLRNGTSLKVTVAKWLTPSGHSIAEQGLEPDVKIEYTKEDAEAGRDPQLDKALELLK
jgi:carboxyl-terminal processing protease